MAALNEDRFTFPNFGEVQLVDGEHDIFVALGSRITATVPLAGSERASSSIRAPPVLGAQYGRQCAGDPRQFLECDMQRLGFKAESGARADERRGIRFTGLQGKSPPQLLGVHLQAQT